MREGEPECLSDLEAPNWLRQVDGCCEKKIANVGVVELDRNRLPKGDHSTYANEETCQEWCGHSRQVSS